MEKQDPVSLTERGREHQELLKAIPSQNFESFSSEVVKFSVEVTKFRCVACKFVLPKAYPSEAAVLELKSEYIPLKLLSKLTSFCETTCANLAKEGHTQLLEVYKLLKSILSRKLLLCAEEIDDIKKLLRLDEGDSIWLNEKAGTVDITACEGPYNVKFCCQVLSNYPVDPVKVLCVSSNFPEVVKSFFFIRATDLSQKCSLASDPDASTGWRLPSNVSEEAEQPVSLSAVQYRQDVRFLKERAEYVAKVHNKASRRDLMRFDRIEAEREKKQSSTPNSKAQTPRSGGRISGNRPGLFSVVEFVVEKCVRAFPLEKCAKCKNLLLSGLVGGKATETDESLERALCGHWFHLACLKNVMENPPFGAECPAPGCKSDVVSQKWKATGQILERRWAQKQAYNREIEDALDFLNLGGL